MCNFGKKIILLSKPNQVCALWWWKDVCNFRKKFQENFEKTLRNQKYARTDGRTDAGRRPQPWLQYPSWVFNPRGNKNGKNSAALARPLGR